MKAEDRKELKQNTLVATLEKVGSGLKEGPSRRTVVIFGIIFLVVVLYIVWRMVSGASESRNSKRWEELYAASDLKDLDNLLSDANKNTVQGRAARLQEARADLQSGMATIYSKGEYDDAVKQLKKAADSFEKLARDFKSTPILVQECLFGAAQAREAIGEVSEAITLYADLARRYPDSNLGKQADTLASSLDKKKAELEKIQAQLKKE
jgi:outer membrane protein assembly factor BamD (BamD/ComL family)